MSIHFSSLPPAIVRLLMLHTYFNGYDPATMKIKFNTLWGKGTGLVNSACGAGCNLAELLMFY